MPKLKIDGVEYDIENGTTLLQACELAGKEIPRFCFHERLSIAGNCRMCLVEVKGMPKPQASCALSVNDLRVGPNGEVPEVSTRSALVKKARQGVMEFLLVNHPLDCPICDQGGECDLQDQAVAYGIDKNRFGENKRAVEDKNIGPLVKTEMTRCIQCTRCVRFTTEVAGVEELGAIGRGEDMEITSYLDRTMTSELQGNIIDLCPVGALTSKPYAYRARPWELRKVQSIDVMDALGSNIRVDVRGREVMRILPRTHEDINEEWLSDKARFIWDGLRTQRLDRPYIREFGKLRPASWAEAFARIRQKFRATTANRIGFILGDLVAVEEAFSLKKLAVELNIANIDCRQDGSRLGECGGRAAYIFNPTIAGLEQADAILIVGSNPRVEAPVLNARLRRAWRQNDAAIALIGAQADLTFKYEYLGAGPETLIDLLRGKSSFFKKLKAAKAPIIILGQGAVARPDGLAVLSLVTKLALQIDAIRADWNGLAILHHAAGRVGALDVGAMPALGGKNTAEICEAAKSGELDILYLLGADEINMEGLGESFIIYQGSHGDAGAHRADVILPGAAFTEKSALYVNTEGRVQLTANAVFPPGEAREDWSIIRALSEELDAKLPWDDLAGLRTALYEKVPHMKQLDMVSPGALEPLSDLGQGNYQVSGKDFCNIIGDYYMTNPIARSSKIMADCSFARNVHHFVAAE